ncbi:MAG: LacI family DNA-binding transcriptional regulator [Sphaerochaeta sp.]|jgi:LacI family transcriptional regulator|uniref:LacI family DNA-binding transcriptional regulator n=1 Tax=Sphaerochaeta sp. TaxID=1972642 RepID=UPI002FC98BC5
MSILLKDIAQATGFSINTVSRAMRSDPKLSEETTALIQKTAQELGYIPNSVAASMRSNRSNMVGIISADSANPFFSEVVRGVEEAATKADYHILLASTEESVKKEAELVKMFLCRKVDGIISMPVFDNSASHLELYRTLRIPFIFPGRRLEGLVSHSILHSDRDGQRKVIEHLLSKGHRKILYIAGPKKVSNTIDRLAGVAEAYANQALELDPDYIVEASGHIEDGYYLTNLALNRGLGFTAVACFNDMLAMGVLKSLGENNLKVPTDIEVFGYDNLYMSQFMQPSLSTVDVPKYRLGYVAMETLLSHIQDPSLEYSTLDFPTRLVFRETTR